MKSYCNSKENAFEVKHVAFLLTWLSKFISCNHFKKVTRPYLGVTMAISKNVLLGPFILNHIFKGMNDLTFLDNGKLSGTTWGPIWIVLIWLITYALDILNWKESIRAHSNAIYRPLISLSSSNIKSFQEFFAYFYENHNSDFGPILPPIIGLVWLKNLFSLDRISTILIALELKHLLAARDLIYSPVLDTSKNNYYTTEFYYLYIAVWIFGLFQDLPSLSLISFNQRSPK